MSNNINILQSETLDVVEPFPLSQVERVWGWTRSFKNMIETDASVHDEQSFVQNLTATLPHVRSWAVIDRDKRLRLNTPHPAPIVGVLMLEPDPPYNGFMHVASSMKAFGSRMMDEAGLTVVRAIFGSQPELLRLSALIHESNRPAISLAKRVGFVKEGKFEDYIQQYDVPRAVLHFGLTRRVFDEKENMLWDSLRDSRPLPKSASSVEEQLPEPSEEVEGKEVREQLALQT